MALLQYLRIVWARKWTVLLLWALVAGAGIYYVLQRPPQYVASASLIVEMRIDPALGALAPALASPSYMATQVEVMRSDRVAARAAKLMNLEASPAALAEWRAETQEKLPFEHYQIEQLQRNLKVEPSPGSNVLNVSYASPSPTFAQAAANAFAEAYMAVSVELRVAPARQSAVFLEEQAKSLRTTLEQAQARLSKFQSTKGIVTTDERLDQENARYNALVAQLAVAEADRVDTSARQRNTGSESSPDVLLSPAVAGLKAQLASAETRLSEASAVVGRNHPTRLQLEAQIAELKQQIAAEVRRVASGTTTVDRGSSQKVGALQGLVEQQKRLLLSLRADRDQVAVLQRDVEAAQRSYDAVAQRLGQISLEGQNSQPNTRLLNPASEPLAAPQSKRLQGILASILGGLVAGLGAAWLLELLDRRVRAVEDLTVVAGVPVIGVLRPAGSRRPVFRRLQLTGVSPVPRLPVNDLRLRP